MALCTKKLNSMLSTADRPLKGQRRNVNYFLEWELRVAWEPNTSQCQRDQKSLYATQMESWQGSLATPAPRRQN